MKKTLLSLSIPLLGILSAQAQCTISGLTDTYCQGDGSVTLVGSPLGGTFSGAGVTGTTFDPALAGAGEHVISYSDPSNIGYSVDQTGTFAPIAGTGTSVTDVVSADDALSAALPIGFSFNFYGVDYTDFYVSSNGFMTFTGGQGSGCCSGQNIPAAGGIENAISFAWTDLNPGSGSATVEYFVSGSAPDQILVMNFTGVNVYGSTTQTVNTQVQLFETTNIIEIHTTGTDVTGETATMGLENVDGTSATAVPGRNATSWSITDDFVRFTPGVCVATMVVTVNGHNYEKPNYCVESVDEAPMITGNILAGSITSTPSGLSVDNTSGLIDFSSSAPGTYTVESQVIQSIDGYTVDQTGTFDPIPNDGSEIAISNVATGDDVVSAALPIGFNFNFYGNSYTEFYLSSNGLMTFTAGQGGSGCCSGQSIPNTTTWNNSIAFAWTDLNPGSGSATVEYFVSGTAPNQILVMNFMDAQVYGVASQLVSTQVLLYETTNVIEIHTTSTDVTGEIATMGVENIDGSMAVEVPGRNASAWSITNDYVSFTPIVTTCPSTDVIIVNDCSVSVDEMTKTSFTVYPNPNNGNFTVEFGNVIDGQLIVLDALGRIVLEKQLTSSTKEQVNLENANGVYQVIVSTKDGTRTVNKVVVK